MVNSARSSRSISPTRGVLHVLLLTGVIVLITIWILEWRAQTQTPWDRWLMPMLALAVGGSLLGMRMRPDWESSLLLVPTLALNVYLLVTVHATLLFMSGDHQRYNLLSALYWVPLGYGLAFVFAPLRLALVISVVFLTGVFAPLGIGLLLDRLPTWMSADGPLLEVIAMSNVVYLCLLAGVSRLRTSSEEARERAELMQSLARTDTLTGLFNRRAVIEDLDYLRSIALRTERPLSVGLIDADHFKAINDSWGHAVGDQVLQQIAGVMREAARDADRLARWGGEEFLFVCPDTDLQGTLELSNRLRRGIAEASFAHHRPLTVSIGLAQWHPGESIDALLGRADANLYAAKAGGRDRVVALSEPAAA